MFLSRNLPTVVECIMISCTTPLGNIMAAFLSASSSNLDFHYGILRCQYELYVYCLEISNAISWFLLFWHVWPDKDFLATILENHEKVTIFRKQVPNFKVWSHCLEAGAPNRIAEINIPRDAGCTSAVEEYHSIEPEHVIGSAQIPPAQLAFSRSERTRSVVVVLTKPYNVLRWQQTIMLLAGLDWGCSPYTHICYRSVDCRIDRNRLRQWGKYWTLISQRFLKIWLWVVAAQEIKTVKRIYDKGNSWNIGTTSDLPNAKTAKCVNELAAIDQFDVRW